MTAGTNTTNLLDLQDVYNNSPDGIIDIDVGKPLKIKSDTDGLIIQNDALLTKINLRADTGITLTGVPINTDNLVDGRDVSVDGGVLDGTRG